MVERKVRWTLNAINDKLLIYEYWIDRNKSISYAEKLEIFFDEAMQFASYMPYAGLETEVKDVRIIIVRSFKVVYRIRVDSIEVLNVWDSRQNPNDLVL